MTLPRQDDAATDTKEDGSCCTPAAPARTAPPLPPQEVTPAGPGQAGPRVSVPGGRALVGTNSPIILPDIEGPMRNVRVKPFLMGAGTVTNAEFARFQSATGYITEAEEIGWSFVFAAQVPESVGPTQAVQHVQWWRRVDGANWRDINGPGTEAEAWLPDHPVVQVSWRDARAYAGWVGGRLPTEAEWEHAARGGQGDVHFPWGDAEPDDTGHFPCNIWQGDFPNHNTGADGFQTTAPAMAFAPNGYGIHTLCGNVWEWTADAFRLRSLKAEAKARMKEMQGFKLLKGGSFLCHKSYCYRYRIAARSGNSPDSTTTHQGFRVVWDA